MLHADTQKKKKEKR